MTTAARPTFEPAKGGSGRGERGDLSSMTRQYSSRDLPGHTKMKYRETGQTTAEEVKSKDFKRDLEERERSARSEKSRGSRREPTSDTVSSSKKPRLDQIPTGNLDADDAVDEESDGDSDDDEAELLAELARIKKEKVQEAIEQEAERKEEEQRIRMENILSGNPLLQDRYSGDKGDFKVKRRWNDDVVFKNCARGEEERKQKHFINDSLRNEFHKKFMEKYIK